MCLECGGRLALDYQRAPSWRLPAAIVGVVVLLAGIGVAIALAAVTNNAAETTAAAPTQPVPPAQSAPGDTPPTTPQATPAPQAPAATTPTPATPTPATPTLAAATGWPPGKSAFTVIIASMPTKAAAEQKLQAAKDAGITTAAILHSDDFPTLRAGYWVVFDGQYDTIDQATQQATADRGKGAFSDAYPRFVSKDQSAKP
jgi:cytoskeletal protein RodZ